MYASICIYIYICIVINSKEKSICSYFDRNHVNWTKLGENWDDVPKFSVILSGTRDGGPYKREDFLAGLAGIIGNVSTRVLSFGPLARNSEWYLVLQDQLSKDRMLLAGTVIAKGVSFRVRSADKTQFVVRVHTGPRLSCQQE